jgi:hypothetical protein
MGIDFDDLLKPDPEDRKTEGKPEPSTKKMMSEIDFLAGATGEATVIAKDMVSRTFGDPVLYGLMGMCDSIWDSLVKKMIEKPLRDSNASEEIIKISLDKTKAAFEGAVSRDFLRHSGKYIANLKLAEEMIFQMIREDFVPSGDKINSLVEKKLKELIKKMRDDMGPKGDDTNGQE